MVYAATSPSQQHIPVSVLAPTFLIVLPILASCSSLPIFTSSLTNVEASSTLASAQPTTNLGVIMILECHKSSTLVDSSTKTSTDYPVTLIDGASSHTGRCLSDSPQSTIPPDYELRFTTTVLSSSEIPIPTSNISPIESLSREHSPLLGETESPTKLSTPFHIPPHLDAGLFPSLDRRVSVEFIRRHPEFLVHHKRGTSPDNIVQLVMVGAIIIFVYSIFCRFRPHSESPVVSNSTGHMAKETGRPNNVRNGADSAGTAIELESISTMSSKSDDAIVVTSSISPQPLESSVKDNSSITGVLDISSSLGSLIDQVDPSMILTSISQNTPADHEVAGRFSQVPEVKSITTIPGDGGQLVVSRKPLPSAGSTLSLSIGDILFQQMPFVARAPLPSPTDSALWSSVDTPTAGTTASSSLDESEILMSRRPGNSVSSAGSVDLSLSGDSQISMDDIENAQIQWKAYDEEVSPGSNANLSSMEEIHCPDSVS